MRNLLGILAAWALVIGLLHVFASRSVADPAREEIALIAAAGADLALTEFAIARGWNEANPLMENRAARIGVKVASTAFVLFLSRKLEDQHPKFARALRWTGISLSVGASAWNVSVTVSR